MRDKLKLTDIAPSLQPKKTDHFLTTKTIENDKTTMLEQIFLPNFSPALPLPKKFLKDAHSLT